MASHIYHANIVIYSCNGVKYGTWSIHVSLLYQSLHGKQITIQRNFAIKVYSVWIQPSLQHTSRSQEQAWGRLQMDDYDYEQFNKGDYNYDYRIFPDISRIFFLK